MIKKGGQSRVTEWLDNKTNVCVWKSIHEHSVTPGNELLEQNNTWVIKTVIRFTLKRRKK